MIWEEMGFASKTVTAVSASINLKLSHFAKGIKFELLKLFDKANP